MMEDDKATRTVTPTANPLRLFAFAIFAILSLSKVLILVAPRGAYALPRPSSSSSSSNIMIMNNSNNNMEQQPPSSSFLPATQTTTAAQQQQQLSFSESNNSKQHDVDADAADDDADTTSTTTNADNAPPFILVVGASGGTGLRVLAGLLDVGFAPSQIRLLTRNVHKPTSIALRQYGFQLVQGDLDIPSTLAPAFSSSSSSSILLGVYVHSTTGDSRKLDTGEVDRARNLAAAIRTYYSSHLSTTTSSSMQRRRRGGVVVYNSSAAEKNHDGIPRRIQQKHDVEMVFLRELGNNNDATSSGEDPHANDGGSGCASLVSLRANLFMEDFWKKYTRPSILNAGKFPFSIPSDRKLHLTSVRDMGRLAGTILMSQNHRQLVVQQPPSQEQSPSSTTSSSSSSSLNDDDIEYEVINVASDVLTPHEMAVTFAKIQNSPCVHTRNHFFAFLVRFFFKDLHEIIHFYRTSTELTDVMALERRFPGGGLLTLFEEFLVETNWSNRELTYENYWTMDIVAQHCSSSASATCGKGGEDE